MDFDYGLLAKYMIGGLTSEELSEVMRWRSLSAENESIFSDLVQLRISWNYTEYNDTERIDKALAKVNARISRAKRRSLFGSVLKYVAVLLLLLSVSYGGYELFRPEKFVTIVVEPGAEIKKVMLADGTAVWLKGASVLKIPESFSAKKRNISLQGDAFFDVAKNAIPFYISTDYVNVGVYGTAFELNVDNRAQKVEATLVRGKIALLDQAWKTVMDMQPGEKVVYNHANNQYTSETIDANLCATWRLDQTIYENETLREIANQLSCKFNVNVNIESSQLAQRKFRCVINKDESLTDILKLLKYLAPVDYRIEGTEIFIWESLTKKNESLMRKTD